MLQSVDELIIQHVQNLTVEEIYSTCGTNLEVCIVNILKD